MFCCGFFLWVRGVFSSVEIEKNGKLGFCLIVGSKGELVDVEVSFGVRSKEGLGDVVESKTFSG